MFCNRLNGKCQLILITCLLFAGCGGHQRSQSSSLTISSPYHASSQWVGRYHVVGTSVENRQIECVVLGKGEDVVLIIASIHGNENGGTPLVISLAEYLHQHKGLLRGRKAVLLPLANPDGVFYNSRFNARGVDLNRNFPGDNRRNNAQFGQKALSEPESSIIHQLIQEYRPNRIVSLHQDVATDIQAPGGYIDWDGPGEDLANRMANCCKLPMHKLGTRPGSLGYYAGESLGIPIITFEQPSREFGEFNSKRLWEEYGIALVTAVVYPQKIN